MWRVRFGLHICRHHNGLVGTFIHLFTFVCSFIHFTHFCGDHNRGVGAGRGHGNKCLGFSTAKPVIQFTTTNSIGNPLTIFNEIVLSFDDKEAGLLNENNTL